MAITRKTTPFIEFIFPEDVDVSTFSWYIVRFEGRKYAIEKDNENIDVETDVENNSIIAYLSWQETGKFDANEKVKAQIYFDIDGLRNCTNIVEDCIGKLLNFEDARVNE